MERTIITIIIVCAEDAEDLDVQAKLVLLLGHGNRSRRNREEDQGEKTQNSGASGQPEHKYRHWWIPKFRDGWDGIRLHIPLLFSWIDKYYCMLYVFLHLPWFILPQL